MSKLLSVNVGLPREIEWRGKVVRTAIWKLPVSRRVFARRLNLDGDGQGDLEGHGGEHRAVMVYQLDAYRYWQKVLDRNDFGYGQFGENFTVEGLLDDEVCIGDRYRIGGAVFEVTQPRVTCYRLGIRMNNPQMAALLVSHRRPGFYFRVITEGEVGAGDEIQKVADGPARITVAEIDSLLYLPNHDPKRIAIAVGIPALSPGWKGSLEELLKADERGSHDGNAGLTSSIPSPPSWTGFRMLRVQAVHRETSDVTSIVLESVDGSPLPAALPGQYLVLRLYPEKDSRPVMRSYSISGASDGGTYRISVKRETGPGSRHVADATQVGRHDRNQCATRRLRVAAGYLPSRAHERWNRRHSCSVYAACSCFREHRASSESVVDTCRAQREGAGLHSGILAIIRHDSRKPFGDRV